MNGIIRIIDKAKGGNTSTLVITKDGMNRVYKNSDNSWLICSNKDGLVRVTKSGNSYFVNGGRKGG